ERAVACERHEIEHILPVQGCAFFIGHGEIIEDRRTGRHSLDVPQPPREQEAPITSKIATRGTITAAPFAPIGHAVAALAMGVWRLVVAIKHRRELALLADRDDRMLADIGLTRSDLRDAYCEPLWRGPTPPLARSCRPRSGHGAP